MASYRLSPNAKDDLERIWFYGFEHWGVTEADRYIEAFYQRFAELAEQPLLYRAVDDIREGYRRSVCGRDSIYYRIDGEDVEIMAVIGQQELDEWL
jgi:toxin ParE1/3/4